MPSSITHAYLAEDVFKRLDKTIQDKINLEEFKTYSEGPDIFYFYHLMIPITKKSYKVRKLGSIIHHNKTNELFINLTEKVKKSKNLNEFNYLIGLFNHYIADSTIHPYVEYKATILTKKHLTKKDNHFIIEAYLDNYLVNKKQINYKKYKSYKLFLNTKKNNDVINLLNSSIFEVFNIKNIGNYYYKSLVEMKLFFKIFRYDPYKIKRHIYNILNIVANRCFRDIRYLSYNFELDNDNYLNLNHDTWCYLNDKNITSSKSILDLYSDIIIKSQNKIKILYDYIFNDKETDLNLLFENLSYGTGVSLDKK